jgi:hypothetical protein
MHACNKSQYPYPDENIFFITGVATDVEPIDYTDTIPLIIVSRKVDAALAKYEDLGRLHKAKPIGCLSLAQLRVMHDRLESCINDPSVKEIKGGLFGAMLGKRQPWMIASMDDNGQPTVVDFVIARSSDDVLRHAKANKRNTPSIYSLELFAEMISFCERVKTGTAKDIVYAIDYKGGELEEQLEEVEKRRSPAERERCERTLERLLQNQINGVVR